MHALHAEPQELSALMLTRSLSFGLSPACGNVKFLVERLIDLGFYVPPTKVIWKRDLGL